MITWNFWPDTDHLINIRWIGIKTGSTSDEIWLTGIGQPELIYTFNHSGLNSTSYSFLQTSSTTAVILLSHPPDANLQIDLSGTVTGQFNFDASPELDRGWLEIPSSNVNGGSVSYINYSTQSFELTGDGRQFITPNIRTIPEAQPGTVIPNVSFLNPQRNLVTSGQDLIGYLDAVAGYLPAVAIVSPIGVNPAVAGAGEFVYYDHPDFWITQSSISNTNPNAQAITVKRYQVTVNASDVSFAEVETLNAEPTGFNDAGISIIGPLPEV